MDIFDKIANILHTILFVGMIAALPFSPILSAILFLVSALICVLNNSKRIVEYLAKPI